MSPDAMEDLEMGGASASMSDEEPRRGGLIKSTSRRTRMIFSVMASPNRIDILRILNSKGPLTYSELKSLAGFKSKKESGKFAYHLRKLLRQSLVTLNKSEKRYTITNLGKLVLDLARKIEERSIIESGKMYVRTSHESIEEFKRYKITQSLLREGGLPPDLADKITEEVENRIYKYQTSYLTGSLIRELVNAALLEHGHEEYRNKLARLGLPVYDVHEMLANIVNEDNGVEGLLFRTGQEVFAEHLLTNTLPKDVADSHLSGDLDIANPGVWSMIPDTIFVNAQELLDGGIDLGGKLRNASRPPSARSVDDVCVALSILVSLLSREASREIVLDGVVPLLSKSTKDHAEIERQLTHALMTSSVSPKLSSRPTLVSLRVALGHDAKTVAAVVSAYLAYARATPAPKIGLVIDHSKGRVRDIAAGVAEIVSLGGRVMFSREPASCHGLSNSRPGAADEPLSIHLESVSLNMPRLAFESNKDETFFRARLALLITPVIDSMIRRKNAISDLTRRGLNPLIARKTRYTQRMTFTLTVNLVGLRESVDSILQCGKAADDVFYKTIETAQDTATKTGKESGDSIRICMADTDAAGRFASLDGDKYGRNSVVESLSGSEYSSGLDIRAADLAGMTPKSPAVSSAARLAGALEGGLLVRILFEDGTAQAEIASAVEAAAGLLGSFRPVMRVMTCSECGQKDSSASAKCPSCKSPYLVAAG